MPIQEIRFINYGLKSALLGQNDLLPITARTNLFYLPKYFRKGERERKGGTKKGGGKDNLTRQGQLFVDDTPTCFM
jgi:hypothetical protein